MILYIGIFIVSFLLTYLIKEVAKRKMLVDIPNERSSHEIPTPRGGGMAIVLVWFVCISYLLIGKRIEQNLYYALMSGVLISVISFLDDIYTLRSTPRILIQVFATAIALYFIGGLKQIDFGVMVIQNKLVLNTLAFIGVIWFVNLYNFIDGINGYSSSGAILIALSLFFFVNDSLLLAFSASVLGFIPWNWGKAKIFMGDIGSTVLGFTIAVLIIHYNNLDKLSILSGLALTSVYWFDATVTLLKRALNKETVTQPHKKHAYQRAVQSGLSHQTVTILSIVLNIILFGLVYLGKYLVWHPGVALVAAIVLLSIVYKLIGIRKPFE